MSRKILLVEDDKLVAINTAKTLEKHGYEVIKAYDGETSVEIVESNPEIDLILMDILLGSGMDGDQAAKQILEKHNVPIVFLSAHTNPEVVDRTKGITSYGYVLKHSGETVMLTSIQMAFDLFQAQSELHKMVEEKDFLMRELNHRVKNNLNMISSLISLRDSETKEDLSDLNHRIEAIRLLHEKLHQHGQIERINAKEYFRDLLEAIFSSTTKHNVKIDTMIEDVSISTKTAIPLGLLINEIATNAIKYGFTSEEEARFTVHFKKDEEEHQYALTLSNTGNPFPEEISFKKPKTMGLHLVSTLVQQLEGTIKLSQKAPTPIFTIRFPVDEV